MSSSAGSASGGQRRPARASAFAAEDGGQEDLGGRSRAVPGRDGLRPVGGVLQGRCYRVRRSRGAPAPDEGSAGRDPLVVPPELRAGGADPAQDAGDGPYPVVDLDGQQRPVGAAGFPGGRQERDVAGEGAGGDGRVLLDCHAPVVGVPGQYFHDLGHGARAAVQDLQDGRREPVAAQFAAELLGAEPAPAGERGGELVEGLAVSGGVAERGHLVRGRERQPEVALPCELLHSGAAFGHHRAPGERRPEDLLRHLQHGSAARPGCALAEGGRGGDGADGAEGAAGFGETGDGAEPAQQHGDVGALGPVVGVELVEDHVGESGAVRRLPQALVLGPLEEQVEHLVVGDQDVRAGVPDLVPVHGHPRVGLLELLGRLVADVQAGANSGVPEAGVPGVVQVVVDAVGLVGGERVHRVQQDGLDALPAGLALAAAVVEQRHEERLGLAGAGAGGHQGGLGRSVQGRQALPGGGLVAVRAEAAWPPGEVLLPTVVLGGPEGRADAQVGAAEDAVVGVAQELFQCAPGAFVRQGVRRRQVLAQAVAYLLGGEGRSHPGFSFGGSGGSGGSPTVLRSVGGRCRGPSVAPCRVPR